MPCMGLIWGWREEAAGEFWEMARGVLTTNGIIAVPTETFYALCANALDKKAVFLFIET